MDLKTRSSEFTEIQNMLEEKYQIEERNTCTFIVNKDENHDFRFLYVNPNERDGGSFTVSLREKIGPITRSRFLLETHFKELGIDRNIKRIKSIIKNSDTISALIVNMVHINKAMARSLNIKELPVYNQEKIKLGIETIYIPLRFVSFDGSFIHTNQIGEFRVTNSVDSHEMFATVSDIASKNIEEIAKMVELSPIHRFSNQGSRIRISQYLIEYGK